MDAVYMVVVLQQLVVAQNGVQVVSKVGKWNRYDKSLTSAPVATFYGEAACVQCLGRRYMLPRDACDSRLSR